MQFIESELENIYFGNSDNDPDILRNYNFENFLEIYEDCYTIDFQMPKCKDNFEVSQDIDKFKDNSTSKTDACNHKNLTIISKNNSSLETFSDSYLYGQLNSRFQNFYNKLFSKYRFRSFLPSESFRDLFSSRNRPSKEEWDDFIIYMLENNFISSEFKFYYKKSRIIRYRFNLKRKHSVKYVSSEYIIDKIINKIKFAKNKEINVSKLLSSLNFQIRMSREHLLMYFEDLVSDNLLIKTRNIGNSQLFALKE